MKILYAIHGYKPAFRLGGPIISVPAAAEMLVKKGHEVTVFCTNSNLDEDLDVPTDRPIDVDGVQVWYFRRTEPLQKYFSFVSYLSKSIGFLYAPKMKAELERIMPNIDVVDTQLPFIYPGYACGRAAIETNTALFYHQRGVFDTARLTFRSAKKRAYIAAVERPILRKATTLIALTEAERFSYRALGVDTDIRVVPNGVDVAVASSGDKKRANKRLGLKESDKVLLFMARLHPLKGVRLLAEAFGRLAKGDPSLHLVLAGPDEFSMEEELRREVIASGYGDRVHFPGMVMGEQKQDLLARADIFCLPSAGEGFSIGILEGLASGTAALISKECHFSELESVGAGRVVERTPELVAAALAGMLSNPDRLRAMGAAGQALVARKYTWDAISDQLIEVYQEGIEKNARSL